MEAGRAGRAAWPCKSCRVPGKSAGERGSFRTATWHQVPVLVTLRKHVGVDFHSTLAESGVTLYEVDSTWVGT